MTSEGKNGSRCNRTRHRMPASFPATLRVRELSPPGRASSPRQSSLGPTLLVLSAMVALFALAAASCGPDSSGLTNSASLNQGETVSTNLTGTAVTSEWPAEETLASEGTFGTEIAGNAEGESTTLSSEETTTTRSVPMSTTTTEKLLSGETRLEDGKIKVMGFIDRVWDSGGKRWLRIDYAEFLTGEEAKEAAIKAGQLSPGEDLPNDYYIRNQSHTLREYQVSDSVRIRTSTWHGVMEAAVTWEEFKAFWSDSPPDPEAALLRESPWWIVRDGIIVVTIDEQYLP